MVMSRLQSHEQMTLKIWVKVKSIIQNTRFFGSEYLYQVWKGSLQWKESYCLDTVFLFDMAMSWVDDLESMVHGQKSYYMTHLLLVVNIWNKYEKEPTSGEKVMVQKWFCFPVFRLSYEVSLKLWVKVKIHDKIHNTPSLSGEYLYQEWKGSILLEGWMDRRMDGQTDGHRDWWTRNQ